MNIATIQSDGRNESIRFAVRKCSLGFILAAISPKGICAISLGDDPDSLASGLKHHFPHARLAECGKNDEERIAKIVALSEKPGTGLDLPLDMQGTESQRKVWTELLKIPAGTTASYSEIARKIGKPKAARAVAMACAANPIALAIPCHRVIHGDGSLSGYGCGVERKRVLLGREGVRI